MSSMIESVLTESRVFPPAPEFVKQANISGMEAYKAMCAEAERDFEGFWAKHAHERAAVAQAVHEDARRSRTRRSSSGSTTASSTRRTTASTGTSPRSPTRSRSSSRPTTATSPRSRTRSSTTRSASFANALKAKGIKTGDRVLVYMPMSIQAVVAMQACARIGATHSVVFGGFSAKSIQERIVDAGAVAVITADGQFRGGSEIPLKPVVDEALAMGGCEGIAQRLRLQAHRLRRSPMKAGRDMLVARRRRAGSPTPASRRGSTPSIRCSSSTPRAPPASPRACSIPPAATCCRRS